MQILHTTEHNVEDQIKNIYLCLVKVFKEQIEKDGFFEEMDETIVNETQEEGEAESHSQVKMAMTKSNDCLAMGKDKKLMV